MGTQRDGLSPEDPAFKSPSDTRIESLCDGPGEPVIEMQDVSSF